MSLVAVCLVLEHAWSATSLTSTSVIVESTMSPVVGERGIAIDGNGSGR